MSPRAVASNADPDLDPAPLPLHHAVDLAQLASHAIHSATNLHHAGFATFQHSDYSLELIPSIALILLVAVWALIARSLIIMTAALLPRKSPHPPLPSSSSSASSPTAHSSASYTSALAAVRYTALASYLVICARYCTANYLLAADGQLIMPLVQFVQLFLAGGVCALVAHALFTPLDVVKTRIQTSSIGLYRGPVDAARRMVAEEGVQVLLKGLGATAAGYFVHGAFKFSFYELFKLSLSDTDNDALHPTLYVAATSGLLAEIIAAFFLCPMEAVRIRSVVDPAFPTHPVAGLRLLFKDERLRGLYKGLTPVLLKQIPYTISQFVTFEFALVLVKSTVLLVFGNLGDISTTTAGCISTAAGALAGMVAAVISQPGDTILSKINQHAGEGSVPAQITRVTRALWFKGLYLGLGARLVHVVCVVSCQFAIYDFFKALFGIETGAGASLPPSFEEAPVPVVLAVAQAM